MRKALGLLFWIGAWLYFVGWFDIDYGISVDEWVGLAAMTLAAWLRLFEPPKERRCK